MTWFRVHDDLVDDPKVQFLSGDLVKALLNLWCLTSKNGGTLPDMKTMAFKLRMKPAQVAAILTELTEAGLIDKCEDNFAPHNWNGRQFKTDELDNTNAQRQKNYRVKRAAELRELRTLRDNAHNALRNGGVRNTVTNVTAKRPDTETERITTSPSVERGLGNGNTSTDLGSIMKQKGWVA